MLIVTSNDIPGHRVDAVFGEVMGLTVRSRDITAQVMAGFRSLGGGEVREMTRALYDSRQQVMARMVAEAEHRGVRHGGLGDSARPERNGSDGPVHLPHQPVHLTGPSSPSREDRILAQSANMHVA
jgi:hypothetical protein